MPKRILADPSFWILLLVNIYCIYYFNEHPEGFSTIVWAYWIQSVMVGIFNFLDLLTLKNPDFGEAKLPDLNKKTGEKSPGCTSFFFLFHFQFFHVMYAVFLLTRFKDNVDFLFLLVTWAAICFELTISFIRNKRLQKSQSINYGKLFFMPYLRIIPMHLTILAPTFLGGTPSTLFLVLKMLADIGMYFIVRSMYSRAGGRLVG